MLPKKDNKIVWYLFLAICVNLYSAETASKSKMYEIVN